MKRESFVCKNIPQNYNNAGFTLAEVLITLAIIGVVATMVIPNLVYNYQRKQYSVAIKKTYSQIMLAMNKMTTDYGCPNDLACTGLFSSGNNSITLKNAFEDYFKTVKSCDDSADCLTVKKQHRNYDASDTAGSYLSSFSAFITADGTSIFFENYALYGSMFYNCAYTNDSKTKNLSKVCARLYVDINGDKAPNCFGRDIFGFYLSNGNGAFLYPQGGREDGTNGSAWWNYNNSKLCSSENSDKEGIYCSGRIVENSWEMDY